jgi:cell wall-associated NlpC family hydrolase
MPAFRGIVRELDFVASRDWCQVTLDGDAGELVATTEDPRVQGLLQVALATGAVAEVEFAKGAPNLLTRVRVGTAPAASRAVPAADEDPAAPAPGDEDRATEREQAIAAQRTNYGGSPDAPEPPLDLSGERTRGAVPTLALDPAALRQFVEACRAAGVTYGLGRKISPHGAAPGTGFSKVDCSGFIREAVWRATSPHQDFPDGSVVQREHVQEKGFRHGTPADGLLRDGAVRIAFLRPEDVESGIGHVVLIHDARTFESHGGVGPDSRAWTNTGWQAKTLVYVLSPAG